VAEARRRVGRPPASGAADTRARLLAVARWAFATRGYGATTNRDLADAAGITTGAIYHYFPSKADLYQAAYEQGIAIVFDEFDRVVSGRTGLLDRFEAVLDAAAVLDRLDSSLAAFVVNVPWEASHHPDLRERTTAANARSRRFFESLVADAVAHAELEPGVDPAAVVDVLGLLASGLARFSQQVGDPGRHVGAATALKLLMAGGLVRPTASPGRRAGP